MRISAEMSRKCTSCLPLCLLVTTASATRTVEPIDVSFGVWTRVGPRNHE